MGYKRLIMARQELEPKKITRGEFLSRAGRAGTLGLAAIIGGKLRFLQNPGNAYAEASEGASMETRVLVGPDSPFNPVVFVNPGEQNYWHEVYDSTITGATEISGSIEFKPTEKTPQGNITGIMITNGSPANSPVENALMLHRMPRDGSLTLEHRHGGQSQRFPIGNIPETLDDFTLSIAEDGLSVKVITPAGAIDAQLQEFLFSRGPHRLMVITNGFAETHVSRLSIAQPPIEESAFPPGEPLKVLAERRGISIGTTAPMRRISYDARYEPLLQHQFNHIVLDPDINWRTAHPDPDIDDWARADQLINAAHRYRLLVKGQHLIWGDEDSLPGWLKDKRLSRVEAISLMDKRIWAVMNHFRDTITEWVAVNEAVTPQGQLRNNIWEKAIGPDWIEIAFQIARSAYPEATLLYNDFGIEEPNSPKTRKVREIVQQLQSKDLINAIGIQGHFNLKDMPSISAIRATMDMFANLFGDRRKVQFTEADFNIEGMQGTLEEILQRQAEFVESFTDLVLEFGSPSLTLWGFEDSTSWLIPRGGESPNLFTNYQPKPSYFALRDALAGAGK